MGRVFRKEAVRQTCSQKVVAKGHLYNTVPTCI